MSTKSVASRYRISPEKFKTCPELEQPLIHALLSIQDDIAKRTDGFARLRVLPPVDLVVSGTTPGLKPWPLQLTQVAGAPVGALLLRCECLSLPVPNGVSATGVSITHMHVENGTVFIDFVSGLAINQKYRLVFGVLDAN